MPKLEKRDPKRSRGLQSIAHQLRRNTLSSHLKIKFQSLKNLKTNLLKFSKLLRVQPLFKIFKLVVISQIKIWRHYNKMI